MKTARLGVNTTSDAARSAPISTHPPTRLQPKRPCLRFSGMVPSLYVHIFSRFSFLRRGMPQGAVTLLPVGWGAGPFIIAL